MDCTLRAGRSYLDSLPETSSRVVPSQPPPSSVTLLGWSPRPSHLPHQLVSVLSTTSLLLKQRRLSRLLPCHRPTGLHPVPSFSSGNIPLKRVASTCRSVVLSSVTALPPPFPFLLLPNQKMRGNLGGARDPFGSSLFFRCPDASGQSTENSLLPPPTANFCLFLLLDFFLRFLRFLFVFSSISPTS